MLLIMKAVHVLAVMAWVGGMFFAHMALRPAVAEVLDPPERLRLLRKTLGNFFRWVWVAILLILVTGYWIFLGPMNAAGGGYLHFMQAVGLVMMGLFCFIYFVPYPALVKNVEAGDFPAAGIAMARIRQIIGVNLLFGLVTSFIAVSRIF